MKKYGAYGIFGCIAGIVTIASFVATIVSHNVDSAYHYGNLGLLLVGLVAALALIVCSIVLNQKESGWSVLPVIGSIFALVMIAGNMIVQRILLIAGLFSYNAMNTIGWQVFYATVAAAACMLVAAIVMIIGAFVRNK